MSVRIIGLAAKRLRGTSPPRVLTFGRSIMVTCQLRRSSLTSLPTNKLTNSAHGDSRALQITPNKRVFVTGGTGFLGYRVVRALLEQGADVTVLVKPGSEDKLGVLRGRVQYVEGDPWNPASLRGRSRGHAAVVHLG